LAARLADPFGVAKAQALVIAIEDLHWADPSTLELIQLLVEQGAPARLLLLYTARPEFHAPWPMRAHHTQITTLRTPRPCWTNWAHNPVRPCSKVRPFEKFPHPRRADYGHSDKDKF